MRDLQYANSLMAWAFRSYGTPLTARVGESRHMHISELRIRNFRNFRSARFSFEKGVNTLIGDMKKPGREWTLITFDV